MNASIQRACLALLVLFGSTGPTPAPVRAHAHHEARIEAGDGDREVVAHHELVRAPEADSRAGFPTPLLRPLPRTLVPLAPALPATVQVALARARRTFTRPRVRRFRPSDPDDF